MNEPMRGIHPESAELQRFADGEATDPQLASHVESCALCRQEIAAVRRVTAALSLGSKVPDSLAARLQARRSEVAGMTSAKPLTRRRRPHARFFIVPVGLAAAAVLVVFVPRALRNPSPKPGIVNIGAKGAIPAGAVLVETTVVTATGKNSIDSVSWEISVPGMTVELRYVADRAESPQARRLADRVAELLREEGIDASAITVRGEPLQAFQRSLPAGAVEITWRSPAP